MSVRNSANYRGHYYSGRLDKPIPETLEEYHQRRIRSMNYLYRLNPAGYKEHDAYQKKQRQKEKVWRAHLKWQANWREALQPVSQFTPRKRAAFFLSLLPHATLTTATGRELYQQMEIHQLIVAAAILQPLP